MGKGLALQFKKAFPANFKAYEAACKNGNVQIGKMFVFEAGGIVLPRYIINFPTKKHWRGVRSWSTFEAGFERSRTGRPGPENSLDRHPTLGRRLRWTDWGKVRPLIESGLAGLWDVEVLIFEPKGAPPPAEMKNETPKPKMTPTRAFVLALMHRYLGTGFDYRLSLLEIQKLAYFLQEAGEPLELAYQANIYGPYADDLRHVLNRIEGHYLSGFGDAPNKPEIPLELLPGAADEAEAFLSERENAQNTSRGSRH